MFNEVKSVLSTDDNVVKFVFTSETAVAEAVLYKYPTYEERTVICCSTQSGCKVGCVFCGTGQFFTRDLTSEEIVQQVVHAVEYTKTNSLSIKKFQIMFMSMGEPFLNYDNLEEAICTLAGRYSNAQLLVSTSAPINCSKYFTPNGRFITLSEAYPQVGIQFSVHESTDEARKQLIPTRTNPISIIGRMGTDWYKVTGRRPFFNYCVHENNNSDADVKNLVKNFNPDIWEVTLSVICEKDQSMKNAIDEKLSLVTDFASKMAEAGYSTRIFNPAGQDDIGGGCGQLWFVQEWAKNHTNK